jgi:hypothetical protein
MSLKFQLMANMIHCKYRTYLRSRAIRGFVLVPEPQTGIAVFVDYVHDNTSSQSLTLTDQISTK